MFDSNILRKKKIATNAKQIPYILVHIDNLQKKSFPQNLNKMSLNYIKKSKFKQKSF